MTVRTMFQADAFTDRLFSGNPAAVLVTEVSLDAALMQAVATKNNLAETALVTPDGSDWAIRWFTPAQEVAFCGHATLAPYWAARLGRDELVGYQASARGGLVACRVGDERAELTGDAVTYFRADVRLGA